ncbi:MAG: DNA polymerase III subunit gamma/tau [bacterium]|nr:DNA polymerase III subunit gamma/tau [bacterium]
MAVLYRKYRPQKLSDIVGQDEITSSLLKQLQSGKISHAYLFSGPRGTGKTSTARILAKALNCEKSKEDKYDEPCGKCQSCLAIAEGRYLDLIEIDAASNRGIDEIRELREKIRLAPTEGRFKVYIIDEVHMLTNEAFNALLKTLEEPPEHAIFILATTELQKVPSTILSRTQRFAFKRPSVKDITLCLLPIAKAEKFGFDKEVLEEIARASDGAFRDALVLLDKVSAVDTKADLARVRTILGKSQERLTLIEQLVSSDSQGAILWLNNFLNQGGNPRILAEDILQDLRVLLLFRQGVGEKIFADFDEEKTVEIERLAGKIAKEKTLKWVNLFTTALVDLRQASIPQLPLEMAIIEACGFEAEVKEVKTEAEVKAGAKLETKAAQEAKLGSSEMKNGETGEVGERKTEIDVDHQNLVAVDFKADMKKVLGAWDTILKELKPKNNSLEIFLRGATPKEIDEGILLIEFGYRFHKDRFDEPKNRAIIEAILLQVLGEPVRIKTVVGTPKPKVIIKEKIVEESDPVEVFGKLD